MVLSLKGIPIKKMIKKSLQHGGSGFKCKKVALCRKIVLMLILNQFWKVFQNICSHSWFINKKLKIRICIFIVVKKRVYKEKIAKLTDNNENMADNKTEIINCGLRHPVFHY